MATNTFLKCNNPFYIFLFYHFLIYQVTLLFEFIETVPVTFIDIVFVTFADTLSVVLIISSHKINESLTILFQYLLFSQIHVVGAFAGAILFTLTLTFVIISFLIGTTCCTIKFAFAITRNISYQYFKFIYSCYHIKYQSRNWGGALDAIAPPSIKDLSFSKELKIEVILFV